MQTNFIDKGWLPEEYKPFSPGNYEKYSPLEKQTIEKINLNNYSIMKNPDKYGIDLLITYKDKIIAGLEVESHAKYWENEFPFKTVHFLGRKKKYKENNNFYIMISAECKNCVLLPFNELLDEYLVIQNNESCKNEPIYDIPKEKCIFGWNEVNKYLNKYLEGIQPC